MGCTLSSDDALAEGLANRPPLGIIFKDYARFDAIAVDLDRRRIETYYKKRGYFGVQVQGPTQSPGSSGDRIRLTWRIQEDEVTRLVAIEIEGAPAGLEFQLKAVSGLTPGQSFEHKLYKAAKTRLRALLVQRGYAHARIQGRVRIHRPRGEAEVVYIVDSGPLVHFGALSTQGLVRTPTVAITTRQPWAHGDVFSPAELETLRARIYEVDQFSGVRLDYEKAGTSSVANIVAKVEEAEQNEVQLGVGGGLDRTNIQLRLRARYKRRAFLIPLSNLELRATPEYSLLQSNLSEGAFTPKARAIWTLYDVGLPRLELENSIGMNFRQLEAFTWFGPDIGQTISKPFWRDRLRAGLGWRFHEYGFSSNLDPVTQALVGVEKALPLVYLEPALTYDGRDNPLSPRKGVYARLSMELGFGIRDNAGGYNLVSPEVRAYWPFGPLVLAARGRLATTIAGKIPAPRRFFAGGASSQRGFSQRQLSPTGVLTKNGDSDNVPIGDETVFETNVEARLRIFKLFGFWVGAVAFVDGADVVNALDNLDPAHLHWAAGGGLRYYTPIGAIRTDVGFRLNRKGGSEPQPNSLWAWHLTLGEAF